MSLGVIHALLAGRVPANGRHFVVAIDGRGGSGKSTVPAGGVFVLERCFSFALPVTWDLKIWVETPREVCLERGTEREVFPDDRGRRVWEQVWQPREDAYIGEQRPQEAADLILDGTRPWSDQLVRSS